MINISIVEGFDLIGKTALGKMIAESYESIGIDTTVYRCNYKVIDNHLGRNKAWVAGFGAVDILKNMRVDKEVNVLFDRGIPSSYVYDRLYGNAKNVTDELTQDLIENLGNLNTTFYYLTHESKESALRIYNSRERVDVLDEFESFDAYWKTYTLCCELYEEFFSKFDIEPMRFTSKSSEDGTFVTITPNLCEGLKILETV